MLRKITDKKKLYLSIKVTITLAILWFLYKALDPEKIAELFSKADKSYIIWALVLLPVNVLMQYVKWRYLVKKIHPETPRTEILGSVFVGISLGFITPGKVGELGKLLYIKDGDRPLLLGASITEKLYDLLPVFVFGIFSIFFLPNLFFTSMSTGTIFGEIFYLIFLVVIFYIALTPAIFKVILSFLNKTLFKSNPTIEKLTSFFFIFEKKDAKKLSLFSFILFLVYTTQLTLLISAFGKIGTFMNYISAWSTIFIKTLLPVGIGDLGVREGASAFIYDLSGYGKEAAATAAFGLFLINIIIPSIAGALLVPLIRFVKNRKNGKS